MATVKTAISVRDDLYDALNELAGQLNMSRSRLVALALEAFIEKQRNRSMLRAINKTYEQGLDETEETLLKGMRSRHGKLLDSDPW